MAGLPTPLTPLIGREHAVARVRELLATTCILTLTGSGGVGKTRVALAAAQEAAAEPHRYPDGVTWVDLATVDDPSGVPLAFGAALGIRDASDRPIGASLSAALRERRCLLVLDNAEHVAGAVAALVDSLLADCPGLTVVATSREPLAVAGEVTWRVPSLGVPDADRPLPLDVLRRVPAVALFLERARAALPDFDLTQENAAAVAHTCRQLDGIPLALELAAARVRAFPIQTIAARLDDAMNLLTGGNRTVRARQQTLRATLDWSYTLLNARERLLFQRLAVFAGGFTLAGAEAVCASTDAEARASPGASTDTRSDAAIARRDVSDLLARLIDRSLVQPEEAQEAPDNDGRFRLLETVRQYASERLATSGEASALRERHAGYFLVLAEAAEPGLRGPDQLTWLARLNADYANLRAALVWTQSAEAHAAGAELGQRLAGALGWWWYFFSGRIGEGRDWLEAAVSRDSGTTTFRAKPLFYAGLVAWDRGDAAHARRRFEESLAAATENGDAWHAALAVAGMGYEAFTSDDLARSAACFAEARRRLERAGEDPWGMAIVALGEAEAARFAGDYVRAETGNETGAALLRAAGDLAVLLLPLQNLAHLALHRGGRGAASRAAGLFGEALAICQRFANTWGAAYCLAGLGRVAAVRGDSTRAARLLSAADSLLKRVGSQLQATDQQDFDLAVSSARGVLGEAAFSAAWEAGRGVSLAAAIAEGQAVVAGAAAQPTAPLSGREAEVAGLIAAGKTNKQIAAALSISEHTAERHVEHILDKLGASSRAQIAAWAAEHNLHRAPRSAAR